MPKISVIIPFHKKDSPFLKESIESVQKQIFQDWEIVLVPNGEALGSDLSEYAGDPKIRVVPFKEKTDYIGKIKHFAFMQGSGEILFELDYDDILTSDALLECADAFEDPKIVFVYSNSAEFKDGTWEPQTDYNSAYGWQYRDKEIDGHKFREAVSFEPSPASISLIFFAPNHFRAWRRDFYHEIGGHNQDLRVCDDQELVIRTYLTSPEGMKHIDKLCYLYRISDSNIYLKLIKEIEQGTWALYNQYIYALVEKWCDTFGYRKIDIGGRFECPEGYESVDLKDADIKADLKKKWPFKDNSIGLIRAHDILEHLPDQRHTMQEIYRVLVPGGWLLSQTPSTDGRGAWQDPTHCSFWNQNSFWYYTRAEQAKFIDNKSVRFQVRKLNTEFLNEWCQRHNIPYVVAHLVKVTNDMVRLPGPLEL